MASQMYRDTIGGRCD